MGLSNTGSDFIFVKKCDIEENNIKVPYWGKSEKVDGVWKVTQTFNTISGELIGIDKESYVYTKGKKEFTQNQFILILRDDNQNFKVSINYSYMSRGILNSLCSIDDFTGKKVEIKLYVNKDEFGASYTTFGGKKTDWAIEVGTLPSKEDPKWESSFNEMIAKIDSAITEPQENFINDDTVIITEEEQDAIDELEPPDEPEVPEELEDLPF